jgi:hypothetical protein
LLIISFTESIIVLESSGPKVSASIVVVSTILLTPIPSKVVCVPTSVLWIKGITVDVLSLLVELFIELDGEM